MTIAAPTRVVVQAEALAWLDENPAPQNVHASVVTSLPDLSEVPGLDLDGWRAWFVDAARRVVRWVPSDGVAIFFQSDIRQAGLWIDKGYLVMRAAEEERASILWHKIVCRKPPGTIAFGRPSYSHMIAICGSGATPRNESKHPGPDVLPDAGFMSWSRAMGVEACRVACRYLRDDLDTQIVIDPFCGKGTVLAVANAMGLDAIGVDLSPKRCRAARLLTIETGERASHAARSFRDSFDEGAMLFDAGSFWDAHEAWETRWRIEVDPAQRRVLQALIQIAAAFHKLLVMHSPESALRIFARGLSKLDASARGPDLTAFRAEVEAYRLGLETNAPGVREVPRLRR